MIIRFLLICVFYFVLAIGLSYAQVMVVHTQTYTLNNQSFNNAAEATVSYTVPNEPNRLVLVSMAVYSGGRGRRVQQVRMGTTQLTAVSVPSLVNQRDDDSYIYGITSPPIGTQSFTIRLDGNPSGSFRMIVGITTFRNVDQSAPYASPIYVETNNNQSVASVTLTNTQSTQLVYAVASISVANVSVPAPQQPLWGNNGITLDNRIGGNAAYRQGTANTTTMQFNFSQARPWSVAAVALNPAFVPLPVELLYFRVERSSTHAVRISWATLQEANSKAFLLERSRDLRSWEVIATVSAAGNSQQIRTYSHEDYPDVMGWVYYRLRQLDWDNNYTLSRVEGVQLFSSSRVEWQLYPNPASDFIYVEGEAVGRQQAVLLSADGRDFSALAYYQAEGDQRLRIDISRLPTGAYLLRLGSRVFKVQKR